MTIKLFDKTGFYREYDIGELDQISGIFFLESDGDEFVDVQYKNGPIQTFAANPRNHKPYDRVRVLYINDDRRHENHLSDDDWSDRIVL